MSFSGFDLDDVRGDLKSNMHDVELKNLNFRYKNGQGRAEVFIDYGNNAYAVSGWVKNIDIHQFRSDLKGRGDVDVDGRGVFLRDPLQLHFRLTNLSYDSDRPFEVKGEAQIMTDFSNYSITSRGEIVNSVSQSPFSLEFRQKDSIYSGSFSLTLKDLNLLIPWKNNSGEMKLLGQILPDPKGGARGPGSWTFSGETLAFPNFSHSLNNFQGFITFRNGQFVLQSFTAEMGTGRMQGNGYVAIEDAQVKDLNFNLIGKEMVLYPSTATAPTAN